MPTGWARRSRLIHTSTMQCPGLLVSSTDASGSWVQSPFSERAAPASLSWSCPFLLLQQIPRSSYIQMAPTPLPPHSHVCMGARLCQSCPTLCHSTNYSIPGFPVLHYLPELAKTRVHIIGDAIQPCHPLVPPAPLHQTRFSLAYLKREQITYIKRWL